MINRNTLGYNESKIILIGISPPLPNVLRRMYVVCVIPLCTGSQGYNYRQLRSEITRHWASEAGISSA